MTVVLATAAALATVAWFLLVLVAVLLTRARDIDPGATGMELGEEPPAVVNLLVHGWRVTPDAVPATLLDLAARDYVELDQFGPTNTVCRLRRTDAAGLEPYERRVLEHVRALAVDGIVPAAALSTGPAGASKQWWRAFNRSVVKDARARGLSRDRWSGWVGRLFGVTAAAPAVLAGLAVMTTNSSDGSDPYGAGIGMMLVGWAGLMAAFRALRGERETPKGAEVARRWLGVRNYLGADEAFPDLPPASVAIWDRYLAYGAAMGVARAAVRALPMGAEDDRWAWSSLGGRWRKVEVDYPNVVFLWGRHPLLGFLLGVVGAVPAYLLVRVLLAIRGSNNGGFSWLYAIASVLALGAICLMLFWLLQAGRALLDLGSRRSFQGQVLRMRSFTTSSKRNNSTRYTAAVDDGKASKVKAWVVSGEVWGRVHQGDLVDVTVGPRLGYVFELRRVAGTPAHVGEPTTLLADDDQPGPGASEPGPGARPASGPAARPEPGPGARPAPAPAGLALPGLVAGMLAGAVVDPASLVTAEDAASALGEPVGPAQSLLGDARAGSVRGCHYQALSGDRASVAVFAASGRMVQMVAGFNHRLGDPVPELGERVRLRNDVIGISDGDAMVSIRLTGPKGPGRDAALKQLAGVAMGRLGMVPAADAGQAAAVPQPVAGGPMAVPRPELPSGSE